MADNDFWAQCDEYEDDDYRESGYCWNCGGSGWIITCIDDLCRGAGECIHGDGEQACRECNADLSKDRY